VRYEAVVVMLEVGVTSAETSEVGKVPYNGVCCVADSEQALADKQTTHLVSAAAAAAASVAAVDYYVADHSIRP